MDCLFCRIAAGEIPTKKIFEDDDIVAFYDIAPQAPVHFLVIPRRHISNLFEMEASDSALLGKMIFKAQQIAQNLGMSEKGGRFVLNCKSDGGQSVNHVHLHVLGGRELAWPPG
ncbi:MAG TPA: histidine triad nucleotide-binding protein [Fibrobacteraceae bacterium]|nr:histidine triad nucleotide-binding protein [Fibrobacteraceae bacterium]